MNTDSFYGIGTPGVAWGDAEKAQWRARQRKQRSYAEDVLTKIDALRARFDVLQYGQPVRAFAQHMSCEWRGRRRRKRSFAGILRSRRTSS